MKKMFKHLFLAAMPCAVALAACKQQQPMPLDVKSLAIQKSSGPDCGKPDTAIFNCATIDFSYPQLASGPDSLRKAVDDWARDFITGWLAMAEEPDNMPPLDEAIAGFFKMHEEQVRDMPDGLAHYFAGSTDTVLLNDGKHLTLRLDGHSYTGGAHPNSSSAVATWAVPSAKKLALDQLVTDLDALQALAEKKFREVRADLFVPGEDGQPLHQFDEAFPFKLADNTGLVADGIYFCYVPYEVGPYAIGSTEFVLTFGELKGLLR
jgi:hypothetical protein